jgi:hypothetical protein
MTLWLACDGKTLIFWLPEDEPCPLDEAVSREGQGVPVNEGVEQPAGQRQTVPQQSAGVGARAQSPTGGASGAAAKGVGVASWAATPRCRFRYLDVGELTAAEKDELDRYENQIVSLTGWLVLAYTGPPETTNCASANFQDWHLELFENPSDHAPREGDPTPIICEITPRTEAAIYHDGARIQSLAEFYRLPDVSYHATGHKACKVRVTGYLMWDDDHNGSADVGSTVQWFSSNGFHHPWRSTAWEIHPVMKIEVLE